MEILEGTLDTIKALQSAITTDLDHARTIARLIARGDGGREVSLAITKLQEAHSWLSLALQEIEPGQI